jgi:predicted MarR family transcription regulator
MEPKFYRSWHLAKNDVEYKVTELEWSIIRLHEAFARWVAAASSVVIDGDIKFSEYVILQVIRMQDRPKNSTTIARIINRDDIPNIQYSLRKLESAGFVQKTRERGGKTFAYSVTTLGEKVTDDYAALRAELLIESLKSIANLDERLTDTTQFMSVLTGIYEEMSRSSASFTHTSGQE